MRKLLTLILILCTIAAPAQMRGGALYDPGAARKNLSNVDASATPSMTSITLSDKVRAAWADILGDIYASGTVKIGAGTAAAPAYTFSSDPDTGIYSPDANVLGFGVGGADVASLSSTGLSLGTPLSVANGGTAATDAATARTNLGVAYGTATGTVCQGNDARLSDARTPVAHEHSGADITSGTVADARIDAAICRDSELTTHGNLTAAHGATGAVVGTTNTQTLTNKTMGSGCSWGGTAVPVANGGTGATTAAEGLAALGGASLNGSSTVDFTGGTFTASAKYLVATGTAAAPAYTFSSDPDTGIYSPGADNLGVSAAGAEAMRVNSAGEVLIATSTDAGNYKLQVNGLSYFRSNAGIILLTESNASTGSFYWLAKDTTGNAFSCGRIDADDSLYLWNYKDSRIVFGTNNAEKLQITNAGNVLIATSTDDGANKLQVNGSIRLIGGGAPTPKEGSIYFNSTDKHFYGYNGTAWVQLDN